MGISTDEFQGCETPVGVIFLGTENKNLSHVIEMCSRAQYKLIVVTNLANPALHNEILSTRITVHNIEEVDKLPALLVATEKGNLNLVRQLLECGANANDRNAHGFTPLVIATKKGD